VQSGGHSLADRAVLGHHCLHPEKQQPTARRHRLLRAKPCRTRIPYEVDVVYGSKPFIVTILSQGVNDNVRGFNNIAIISQIIYYQQKIGK
jgi:hypothetical protein